MKERFDYDDVVWGAEVPVRGSLFSSGSFILDGLLKAFADVEGHVLDAGCGGGAFIKALKVERPDLKLVGVDIGKGAINYAKRTSQGIDFMIADVRKLPFKNESFDAIFSIEVLEHIDDTEKVISEMYRVLKPEGKLYLSVSCEKSLWTILGILGRLGINLTRGGFGHIKKFSSDYLLKTLETRGFKVKRKFYFGHLIRQLEDLLYLLYLLYWGRQPGDLWKAHGNSEKLSSRIAIVVFKFAFFLSNLESKIFRWFPGVSIQIEAKKR